MNPYLDSLDHTFINTPPNFKGSKIPMNSNSFASNPAANGSSKNNQMLGGQNFVPVRESSPFEGVMSQTQKYWKQQALYSRDNE